MERLDEIVNGPAFQCHKTIDYENFKDDHSRQGSHPQQCAGLMSVLHAAGKPNQIMQMGERMGYFDPEKLETSVCFDGLDALYAARRATSGGKSTSNHAAMPHGVGFVGQENPSANSDFIG